MKALVETHVPGIRLLDFTHYAPGDKPDGK